MATKAVKRSKKSAKSKARKSPPLAPEERTASAGKSGALKRRATTPAPESEALAKRLEALLHSMRCIAQHEDELCTLLHDARRTGRVGVALLRELQTVLDALPAEEYTDDLYQVRSIALVS